MDVHSIFQQVQKMRPSSFSEEERRRYQAEKMLLRQFKLMKQQDEIPESLSVRHMKTRLLTGRKFLDEFQEIIKHKGIDHLLMAELAWTTARHFCVNLMEEELQEQQQKEEHLSQLFNRKVTLEGLSMFLSSFRPGAEEDVRSLLPSLHRKLLHIFLGVNIARDSDSAGDAKPATLVELEQITAPLVPGVVDTALQFLLDEPENNGKAASDRIGQLLNKSVIPYLSQHEPVHQTLLLGVCTTVARFMIRAINRRFKECSMTFKQMDYEESLISARQVVIAAIEDMTQDGQTHSSSQAHPQLFTLDQQEDSFQEKSGEPSEAVSSEEVEEERGARPQVSLAREMVTMQTDVKEDAPLVNQDTNVTLFCDDKLEDSSPGLRTSEAAEHQQVDKTEASPQAAATEELENKLLEKEDSSEVTATPMQNSVAKNTYLVGGETNVVVCIIEDALEVLQQENEVSFETRDSLSEDCKTEKKKKGVKAFFCSVWKSLTCCFGVSTDE